jgi:hypothetical protein
MNDTLKIDNINADTFYNLDTEKVRKQFKKDLHYCNTFTVKSYLPYAVYSLPEPDSEGKKYLLLTQKNSPDIEKAVGFWLEEEQIKPWIMQEGIRCKKCGDVIHSRYVHDFRHCKCEAVFVDGGRDYTRIGGSDWEGVHINLIEHTYTVWKTPEQEKEEWKNYLVTYTATFTAKVSARSIADATKQIENSEWEITDTATNDRIVKVTKICLDE